VCGPGVEEIVVACAADEDVWRRQACDGLAERLREMTGAGVRVSDQAAGAGGLRVAVEWVRSADTFVMARLSWRKDGEAVATTGPVIEFSVNDRQVRLSDAGPFGRVLADSFLKD